MENSNVDLIIKYLEFLGEQSELNEEFLAEMAKMLAEGELDLEELNGLLELLSKKLKTSGSLYAQLSHFLEKKVSTKDIEGIAKSQVISELIGSQKRKLAELLNFKEQLLRMTKSFGEIVKKGPTNLAEVALIKSAETFLEPSELSNAVINNLSVREVLSKIQGSQVMKNNIALATVHQEALDARSDIILQEDNSIKHDLKVLGREYGVLDTIMQSLSKVDDKSNTPNLALGKSKGGSWSRDQ